MHEGTVKPFEEMTWAELLQAAHFWQSEYERVVQEQAHMQYPLCLACGVMHNPTTACVQAGGNTLYLSHVYPMYLGGR